jgi:hypothetical protein
MEIQVVPEESAQADYDEKKTFAELVDTGESQLRMVCGFMALASSLFHH